MRKQLSTGQATVPDYENSASTQNQIPRNSVPNNNSIFREKHIIRNITSTSFTDHIPINSTSHLSAY